MTYLGLEVQKNVGEHVNDTNDTIEQREIGIVEPDTERAIHTIDILGEEGTEDGVLNTRK